MRKAVLAVLGWLVLAFPSSQLEALAQSSVGQTTAQNATSGVPVDGATPYSTPETTSEGVLREMANRADVIFSGTVAAVIRGADDDLRSNAGSSIVEVDFAVDHAVKGVSAGSSYAMREWAGLWRDSPRFAVGQRLLMLLHGAGPSGLSSPVDGLDGAIPIKATTVLPAPTDSSPSALTANATLNDATPDDVVDMRWLQARTLRVQTYAEEPVATPGESSPVALSTATPLASAATATPATPATATGLTHVLGLLTSWRETANVSH